MKARVLCFCGRKVAVVSGPCQSVCKCGFQWSLYDSGPIGTLRYQSVVEPWDFRYNTNSAEQDSG